MQKAPARFTLGLVTRARTPAPGRHAFTGPARLHRRKHLHRALPGDPDRLAAMRAEVPARGPRSADAPGGGRGLLPRGEQNMASFTSPGTAVKPGTLGTRATLPPEDATQVQGPFANPHLQGTQASCKRHLHSPPTVPGAAHRRGRPTPLTSGLRRKTPPPARATPPPRGPRRTNPRWRSNSQAGPWLSGSTLRPAATPGPPGPPRPRPLAAERT